MKTLYKDLQSPQYQFIKNNLKNPTFIEHTTSQKDYSDTLSLCLDLLNTYPKIISVEKEVKSTIVKLDFGQCKARLVFIDSFYNTKNLDAWSENDHYYWNIKDNKLWKNRDENWDLIKGDETQETIGQNSELEAKVNRLLKEIHERLSNN